MGLEVTSLNIQDIEKRYMSLNIQKGDGVGTATIVVETGYYADNVNKKNWTKIITEEIHLHNDLLNILVAMNHTKLGVPVEKVSTAVLLETLVYGVIAGQIPIHANVTVVVQDASGVEIPSTIELTYKDQMIYASPSPESTKVFDRFKVMLGVGVTAKAEGYVTKTVPVTTWYGDRTVTVVLEAESVP